VPCRTRIGRFIDGKQTRTRPVGVVPLGLGSCTAWHHSSGVPISVCFFFVACFSRCATELADVLVSSLCDVNSLFPRLFAKPPAQFAKFPASSTSENDVPYFGSKDRFATIVMFCVWILPCKLDPSQGHTLTFEHDETALRGIARRRAFAF
jgi:hypothetical protein